jgi:hypothetical protein
MTQPADSGTSKRMGATRTLMTSAAAQLVSVTHQRERALITVRFAARNTA